MKEFFKKVSEQISTSIKFLINPSSWKKGYEQGKEYFPHLKTLVTDDIDVQKIAEFVTKNRKEQQVYKIITTIALINGAIAFVPGQMGIGIVICRGLEAYMAFEISKTVGLKVELKNNHGNLENKITKIKIIDLSEDSNHCIAEHIE